MRSGGSLRARAVVGVAFIVAAVLPGAPAVADVCRPFCAAGGILSGADLNLPLFPAAFSWSLSFQGAVGGQTTPARQLTSTARFHGVVESVAGATVSGVGTLTVYDETGSASFVAVPMRFSAAGTASGTTLHVESGAGEQLAIGGGYGATFSVAQATLRGAVHAPRALDDEEAGGIDVTIAGPALYTDGQPIQVSGDVRGTTGARLPGLPVDVLVDGDYVTRVTTGSNGTWSAPLTFSDGAPHVVHAVALRETPMAATSPGLQIAPSVVLSVTVQGSGTVSGPSISCTATCSYTVARGTEVSLTATAGATTNFAGWSGACAGTGTCTVIMDQARSVTATFALKTYLLSVAKIGTGTGTVSSNPAGISCGAGCSASYSHGTTVTLTAVPDISSTFNGWSGACTGTGTCTVSMTSARNVSAVFALKMFTLAVTKNGSGAGTVTSTPAGISCGGTCSAQFGYGTLVTLSAAADVSSTFAGWSGACTGTGTCAVTMDQARNVAATFTLKSYTLAVATSGSGTVTSSPAGISCGASCIATYTHGTFVTLTATPDASSNFAGWSGACTGTGSCVVSMTAARTVNATFTVKTYALQVTRAGSGTGVVTSTPAGISCGATCSATYTHGTVVTLTATPDASSDFSGWSGACTGTGTCTVSMTAARTVTATFTLKTYLLTVVRNGSGSGTVTSTPAGISCGGACSASFSHGTNVTLTATPDAYSSFDGWSGACSGTGACVISMTQAGSVSAAFSLINADIVETEPNGTTATAGTVTLPVRVAGALPAGDVDLVRFDVNEWTALHIETFDPSMSGCASIDTVVRLLNEDGTPLASDDDGGVNLCSVLDRTVDVGTYFVEVTPFGTTSASSYRLHLVGSALASAYEPNDTLPTAAFVVTPANLDAAIAPVGDLDHYEVTSMSMGTLYVDTFDGDGATCAGIDTVVRIYDSEGFEVGMDDDSGPGFCSSLALSIGPGSYVVRIEDFGNDGVIGRYRASIVVQSFYP